MTPEVLHDASVPYFWQCNVDSVATTPVVLDQCTAACSVKICSEDSLQDTDHIFTFNIFLGDTGGAVISTPQIVFDYLEYLPPANQALGASSFVDISPEETGIAYNPASGWFSSEVNDGTTAQTTTTVNASVEYQFVGPFYYYYSCVKNSDGCTGSSVGWIAFSLSGDAANASFSIDSSPPIIVSLPFIPLSQSVNGGQPNEIIFQSQSLDPTIPHTLQAVYLGGSPGSKPVPFTLQSIVVGNGTLPSSMVSKNITTPSTQSSSSVVSSSSAASSPSATQPPPTINTSLPTSNKTSRSYDSILIAAGVTAGCIFVIMGILLALLYRRRRHATLTSMGSARPFTDEKDGRWIFPPINEMLVVPPSMMRRNEPRMRSIDLGLQPAPASGGASVERRYRPATWLGRMADVREEDSGLRLVEDSGPEEVVRVLPPAYTVV